MKGKVGIFLVVVGVLAGIFFNRHLHQETAILTATPEGSESAGQQASNAPRIASAARSAPSAQEVQTNRNAVARFLRGEEVPKLTRAQIEPFLEENHHSAGSLLAALRTTGDKNYLLEAMQKFPNDPRVNYTAAFRADITPEERRQALENLKQSDPNNALGNYLSAADYFKSGNPAQALQEMSAAAKKPGWTDYTSDFMQNAQEAYRAAGYSDAEAKVMGGQGVLLPDLAQLKSVGLSLADLAKSYQQSGDTASAQASLQMAMNLGQQMSSSLQQPLVTTLVGMAIEKTALSTMDPAAPYGDSGQTVQDQLNALQQQRQNIRDLAAQEQAWLSGMNDEELATYFDRIKTFGSLPTMQWAAAKYGK